LLKPGGLIVLRHYYRIKPKLVDFKLERRVVLGDDVLAMFVPFPDTPAEAGAAKLGKPLPRKPRSPKMKP
jgi:hypothetical protein